MSINKLIPVSQLSKLQRNVFYLNCMVVLKLIAYLLLIRNYPRNIQSTSPQKSESNKILGIFSSPRFQRSFQRRKNRSIDKTNRTTGPTDNTIKPLVLKARSKDKTLEQNIGNEHTSKAA